MDSDGYVVSVFKYDWIMTLRTKGVIKMMHGHCTMQVLYFLYCDISKKTLLLLRLLVFLYVFTDLILSQWKSLQHLCWLKPMAPNKLSCFACCSCNIMLYCLSIPFSSRLIPPSSWGILAFISTLSFVCQMDYSG